MIEPNIIKLPTRLNIKFQDISKDDVLAKMAQETQKMAPSYKQTKAKIREIHGTMNLGFKRPVHEGYKAIHERDQNRQRMNAKIMAAGLDLFAFNFNRRGNSQGYAAPVNLLAALPQGQPPSTPNYGSAGPAPAYASPPSQASSPGTDLDPMALFHRFQEFMRNSSSTSGGLSGGAPRSDDRKSSSRDAGTGAGSSGDRRNVIDADRAEFVEVPETPGQHRDKRKRADRTPGPDPSDSPALKRGDRVEADDDVLRELFAAPVPDT